MRKDHLYIETGLIPVAERPSLYWDRPDSCGNVSGVWDMASSDIDWCYLSYDWLVWI